MSKNSKQLAIVIGAARGIGYGVMLRLVSEGYTVLALDMDETGLGRLREETDVNRCSLCQLDP